MQLVEVFYLFNLIEAEIQCFEIFEVGKVFYLLNEVVVQLQNFKILQSSQAIDFVNAFVGKLKGDNVLEVFLKFIIGAFFRVLLTKLFPICFHYHLVVDEFQTALDLQIHYSLKRMEIHNHPFFTLKQTASRMKFLIRFN